MYQQLPCIWKKPKIVRLITHNLCFHFLNWTRTNSFNSNAAFSTILPPAMCFGQNPITWQPSILWNGLQRWNHPLDQSKKIKLEMGIISFFDIYNITLKIGEVLRFWTISALSSNLHMHKLWKRNPFPSILIWRTLLQCVKTKIKKC